MKNMNHSLKTLVYTLVLSMTGIGWVRADALCDYDGDHLADVAAFDSADRTWNINLSRDTSTISRVFGTKETKPFVGDFDGDGITDIGVYERKYGTWWVIQSSDGSTNTTSLGSSDMRPVPADYDGDGITDRAVYQNSTAKWYILRSSDGQTWQGQFGWNETRPVPADYDGDGKADIAVYHRRSGNWYISQSATHTLRVQNWGWSPARPVPADYDGDGKTDIAVYHRAAGNWYIINSSNYTASIINWGFIQSVPVPDDYDGDGKTDLAVYDTRNGDWYIRQSTALDLRQQNWGAGDMAPLPSFRDVGMQGLTILAFGDSITYGMGSDSGGPRTGYPELLTYRAEAGLGGHYVAINAGNPGETTSSGAKRIKTWLATFKPDITLIMEGCNDTFFKESTSKIISNLRSMVSSARAYGSTVILSTVTPVIKNKYRDRSSQEARIEQLNPYIKSLGASLGVSVADGWTAITSQPNWQSDLIEQRTANHPNDAGYLILRDEFYRVLASDVSNGLHY